MLLPALREEVLDASRELVLYTFGNASARNEKLVLIGPSGVPYETMKPEDMVVTDLEGKIVEGKLRPSSHLPTHLVLYKALRKIGAVTGSHSQCATAGGQARKPIPCFPTTPADCFQGPVPVSAVMKSAEMASACEENPGREIVRPFEQLDHSLALRVANHVPFAGRADSKAAHTAVTLEAIARTAYFTIGIHSQAQAMGCDLHDKHFLCKQGSSACYRQKKDNK